MTTAEPGSPALPLLDGGLLPQVGLGTWKIAEWDARRVVGTAIETGYRLIDSAAAYGNERGVGEGVREGRSNGANVAVATKLRSDQQGYDKALRAFDESLARLGLSSVDLYLIHWPAPARGLYVETWRALVRLQREGRARSIGVSNFEREHLQRLIEETGVPPSVNQVELHPAFQQDALRSFHARHGVRTQAWSPLGQGAALDHPVIREIAERRRRTPAQIVIRWHLEQDIALVPKSAHAQRMRENLAVFDFALTPGELDVIAGCDRATGRLGPHPASVT